MNKFCKLILAAAVVALAVPAMAENKLIIRNSDNTQDVFTADNAGGIMVNNASGLAQSVLTNTGRIGLGGNTNPAVAIHAKGPDGASSQAIMHMNYPTTTASGGGGFITYHNNNNALPNSGDRLGYFLFGSINPGDGYARNGAGMASRAEGAWTATNFPAYFTFETAPPSTLARYERLRITSNGNIVTGNLAGTATDNLALSVTDGFLYIPTTAGAVTSCATVTTYTGHVPLWYDVSNNKLCTCNAGVRKCAPSAFN